MKHTKGKWGSFENFIYVDVGKGALNFIYGRIAELFGKPKETEANAKLIAAAPELLEAIQKAIKISSLWTFDKDVTIEHEDEAKALHSMHLEFDRVIKKATK